MKRVWGSYSEEAKRLRRVSDATVEKSVGERHDELWVFIEDLLTFTDCRGVRECL